MREQYGATQDGRARADERRAARARRSRARLAAPGAAVRPQRADQPQPPVRDRSSSRLARLKAIAKAAGGTLNDVILALCVGEPAPLPRRARRAARRRRSSRCCRSAIRAEGRRRAAATRSARSSRRSRPTSTIRRERLARDRRVDDAREAAAPGHVEGGDPPVQRAAHRAVDAADDPGARRARCGRRSTS